MRKTSDYHFELPNELIAQYPSQKRDESRLMHIDRSSGKIAHYIFKDIVNFFTQDDLLVINNTKVLPSRLFVEKANTGGKVELFLLRQLIGNTWEALIKPAKKVRNVDSLVLEDCSFQIERYNEESNSFQVRIDYAGDIDEFMKKHGHQPLPPYIKRADEESDKERYQTIYAKEKGAVAAPTAGLHFTEEILKQIEAQGAKIAPLTLHVGLGTFRPVTSESIDEHHMHEEYYEITETSATLINEAHLKNKVTCVGTTSVRTIESACEKDKILAQKAATDIFINPGYEFKMLDRLITNFHTPESTLMMLISAFAGYDLVKEAYATAVKEKYRFFSYGDSMIIT